MRCCLVSIGSRGDVDPFIGLGQELARRGHQVRLVVLEPWAGLVGEAGLECHAVPLGAEALWPASPLVWRAMVAQPGLMYAGMVRQLGRAAPTIATTTAEAGRDADLVVSGLVSSGAGQLLAADRDANQDANHGAAAATLLLGPLLPSRDPARTVLGPRHVPGAVTAGVSQAMWQMTRAMGHGQTRALQSLLGRGNRAPGTEHATPILVATSPVLSPPEPGWPSGVEQVGRIAPTARTTSLPEDTAGWLAEHPGAVLMGFGSILRVDTEADGQLFRDVARRAGRPLLLQDSRLPRGPVGGAEGQPVWNETGLDHRVLLPELAAVVHHGGAGTTATALAAQCPSVVVPHLGDQSYYARRVQDLNVGSSPGPRWRTTTAGLARALDRALDDAVVGRCRSLGPRLQREDGAARAADRLETLVSR